MTANMVEVELWACVDASGDYGVGKDEEAACQAYEDDIGGTAPRRLVKLTVKVPAPAVVELTGEAPADAEAAGELRVA